MSKLIDLTGQRFERLIVLEKAKSDNCGHTRWKCKCDCGNITVVNGCDLKRQKIKSCGCLHKQITKIVAMNNKKHGKSKTRLYKIWSGVKSRCYYQKNIEYMNYGGRGIKVCNEWLNKENGFMNFYNWAINNGYKENLTIDRIDNNGNYEPNNCRWITYIEQENNKRNNTLIQYKDKQYTLAQLSRKIGINSATLSWRIKHNWNENELDLKINLANRVIRKELQKNDK